MFLEIFGVHLLRFSQVPKYLGCQTTRPLPQVSSFSKFLWLRSDPLYQTHAYTVWSVLHVMYVTLKCSIRLLWINTHRTFCLTLQYIMASNRYLIGLVHLWLFVILLDFFIPLYFITVQENRKNRKLRKQKIAQKDFCKQWNEKQYIQSEYSALSITRHNMNERKLHFLFGKNIRHGHMGIEVSLRVLKILHLQVAM